MGPTEIIISLVGGFCAGILNTLAGFGSIITLAIYMEVLGIPGNIANATNRVNVLASSSISAATFYKNGKLNFSSGKSIILAVSLGALVGVYMATQVDAAGFKSAYNFFLIPIFIILILNPKRFITPNPEKAISSPWLTMPLYFIIGIYAGFIQAGFGVLFLIIAVIFSKYDLINANGLKIGIVALYTAVIVVILHLNGLIRWEAGLAIAAGQALGGYVASKNASKMEGANKYAYWFLIVIVGAVIIKNFVPWSSFM